MSLVTLGGKPPPAFDDPVGVLVHCHRKLEEKLATMERAVAIAATDVTAAREALAHVLGHLAGPGARHSEDEEFSVFPRVAGDDTNAVIDELTMDHRVIEAIHLALRDVVERLPDDPAGLAGELGEHARALAEAYRAHMKREEDVLFPIARGLDEKELRAIGIEMRLRRGGSTI
jgi:pyridoxamine 5'-phosphate oxidase